MCRRGETTKVRVKAYANLSPTGEVKWKDAKIDSCIAPIVAALQMGGIDMQGSCCGHGEHLGDIHLLDGRILLIADGQQWFTKRGRYLFRLWLRWIKWCVKWAIHYYWERIALFARVLAGKEETDERNSVS